MRKRITFLALMSLLLFANTSISAVKWNLFAFSGHDITALAGNENKLYVGVSGDADYTGFWECQDGTCRQKLNAAVVNSISVNSISGDIWVGIEGAGLKIFSKQQNAWSISNPINVYSIAFDYSDKAGNTAYVGTGDPAVIWKTTNNGIDWCEVYDGGNSGFFSSIAIDGNSIYAVNSENGVLKYVPGFGWEYYNYGLTFTRFTKIVVLGKDWLVLGSQDALFQSFNGAQSWVLDNDYPNYITDIAENHGTLYVSSAYEGISAWGKEINDGLPYIGGTISISCLTSAAGNLFAGGKGVYVNAPVAAGSSVIASEEKKGCFILSLRW